MYTVELKNGRFYSEIMSSRFGLNHHNVRFDLA